MISHFRRYFLSMALLLAVLQPQPACSFVVVDLAAEQRLLTSIQGQMQQIRQMTSLLSQGKQNLQSFANAGKWTNISQRLQDLQAIITQAKQASVISPTTADDQIRKISQEISQIDTLQKMTDSSKGILEAQQANGRLTSELISQIMELRQLELSKIKQNQAEEAEAVRYETGSLPSRSSMK